MDISMERLEGINKADFLELISKKCEHIKIHEPYLHAMVEQTIDKENVLKRAGELFENFPDKDSRPSLFGVTLGVKDIFRVDGFPTRCGSDLPRELFDGKEATCVSRLKNSGVLIIGKTVTTEFACFEPGPTRNPFNYEHTPGGSSSGSAAGLSKDYFMLSLGTQTAGSISRPASYCGILGFKPSYGRISLEGIIPFSPSCDHVGLFAKDLNLFARAMQVIDDTWKQKEATKKLQSLRIGIPDSGYLNQITKNCKDHFVSQTEKLDKSENFTLKNVELIDDIEMVNNRHTRLISGEFARVHEKWYRNYKSLYRKKTVETIEKGLGITEKELEDLREKQTVLREYFHEMMNKSNIDCMICPSTTDHAPKGLETTGSPIMNLPWTFAGLPTMSIPMPLDQFGLPIGLQIINRFWEDEKLICYSDIIKNALNDS